MTAPLERRGPERTGVWRHAAVGLGHTLLATTPELVFERQPLEHAAAGCVIVADVRLDNRAELLAALGLADRAPDLGDAGLILEAYLAWGENSVERLLGDFAFAIHDSRQHRVFCARDALGLRPLNYHHAPGRCFAFASEPQAIIALVRVPQRINEARIADFLVGYLEGIDKTSTFFEDVYRLPPAHALSVTRDGLRMRRYWRPEPVPELRLASDEAYAEAFLEVFTDAVLCRLRSPGPVGSMLSGGMDSGSVVAVARELLASEGRGPLPTFSGVGPEADTCVETAAIHAAVTMPGLDPTLIDYTRLDEWLPELEELTWAICEPFDGPMTIPRVAYLAAHRRGIKVMLDGVGGDSVLHYSLFNPARLLRRGQPIKAWRQIAGLVRFHGGIPRPSRDFVRVAQIALKPDALRRFRRRRSPAASRQRLERTILDARMDPWFGHRIGLEERLQAMDQHRVDRLSLGCSKDQAWAIDHPFVTVARERYDRVAAAVGIEPRDPFLDRRVVDFCLALPCMQKLCSAGWPKVILRRAMAGNLPDPVRWRRGKQHLGASFTSAVMRASEDRIRYDLKSMEKVLRRYMQRDPKGSVEQKAAQDREDGNFQDVFLALWLKRCSVLC